MFRRCWRLALGTLLCAALVKRRAGGGMLYTVRFPILVPHTVVALFIMTLLGQTGIVARAAYGLGLISDYTKFPEVPVAHPATAAR